MSDPGPDTGGREPAGEVRRGLAFVVQAADAGPRIEAVLTDIAAVARDGDWIVCVDTGRDDKTLIAIRIFEQIAAIAPGVVVRCVATDAPGPPGCWTALALSALRAARRPVPSHLVFLPGRTAPGTAPLERLRTQILTAGADMSRLVAEGSRRGGDGDAAAGLAAGVLERHAFRTAFLFDLMRGAATADGAPLHDLALMWQVRCRVRHVHDIVMPAALSMPVPETGPAFVAAAAALMSDGTPAAGRLGRGPAAARGAAAPDRPTTPAGAATGPAALSGDAPRTVADWLAAQIPGRLATVPRGLRRDVALALAQLGLAPPVPARPVAPAPAPAIGGRARIRVLLCGEHAHRTPLAYAALAPFWRPFVEVTGDPGGADLIVIAHPQDTLALPVAAAEAVARRHLPLMLYSEEPFWDSLFSPDPVAQSVILPAAHLGQVRVHQVTHHRGQVFDFDRIPYYLLTLPGFATRYAARFARNAQRTAGDWRTHFAGLRARTVFMAENRPEAFHDVRWPEAGLIGLCAWRTRLASACAGAERLGLSWGSGPSRFGLPDWHADKLDGLDDAVQTLSAIENTHQPAYVSEKFFDAFACGARPLYMAAPGHRVHDLGLPSGAWLNLWGLDVEGAAMAVAAPWDDGFATVYAQAQRQLATLFAGPALRDAECRRIGRAVRADVETALG